MRHRNMKLSKCYSNNESENKKQYNEKVLQVELDTITPLVMPSNVGFGRECARFYSKLVEENPEKQKLPYSVVCPWFKTKNNIFFNEIGCSFFGGTKVNKESR